MDPSPSPTSFGNRSLSNLFSKPRSSAVNRSSTTAPSIMSGTTGDVAHHAMGTLRAHFDNALEKLKIHESSGDGTDDSFVGSNSEYGEDEDDESRGHGLGKLIPKRLKRRQRRKEAAIRASEEVERGRNVAERGTLENVDEDYRHLAPSNFGQGDGSSTLTFESDLE